MPNPIIINATAPIGRVSLVFGALPFASDVEELFAVVLFAVVLFAEELSVLVGDVA